MVTAFDDFTDAARGALTAAQAQAARRGTDEITPEYLLLGILAAPGALTRRTLAELRVEPAAIARAIEAELPPTGRPPETPIDLGSRAKSVVAYALKEARHLGHRQIDALHLLMGILYLPDGGARAALQGNGVRLYDLRAALLDKPGLLATPRDEELRRVLRPSPIFLGLLGLVAASGAGLFLGAPDRYARPLTILFVVSGWIASVCIHEFGHALAAWCGGDRSVREKGYLTLDPRRYTHPLLSVVLPVVSLLLGGLGLPGGAVYIDRSRLRGGRWESFVSAAGPLGTLACGLLIALPFFLPWRGWVTATNYAFWPALAYLAFLQVTGIVFNLLPIPGLDGFNIIAPGLPHGLRQNALRLGTLPLFLLYMVLWQDNPLTDAFWGRIFDAADLLHLPLGLVLEALAMFGH